MTHNFFQKLIFTIFLMGIFSSANAQNFSLNTTPTWPRVYAGFGVSTDRIKLDGKHYTNETFGIILGNQLNDYFAIETRLNFGLTEDKDHATQTSVKQRYNGGLYLKGILPIYKSLTSYALIGAARTSIKQTNETTGEKQTFNKNGGVYGVGLTSSIASGVTARVEYTGFYSGSLVSYQGLRLGLGFVF